MRCRGGGTLSPSYPQPHLSNPTVLRGPKPARCGLPVGTEFIFPASCDNTWLCLFNFLLWMERRWARKISLAPSDQNIRAHTSCEDTHTEKLPLHRPKKHMWAAAGGGWPRGSRKAAQCRAGQMSGYTHPAWPARAGRPQHPLSPSRPGPKAQRAFRGHAVELMGRGDRNSQPGPSLSPGPEEGERSMDGRKKGTSRRKAREGPVPGLHLHAETWPQKTFIHALAPGGPRRGFTHPCPLLLRTAFRAATKAHGP